MPSIDCPSDSAPEECSMKVDLMQRDLKITSSFTGSKLDVGRECRNWCSKRAEVKTWTTVCTWSKCQSCSDCPAPTPAPPITTSTTTTTPTTTTTTTPTTTTTSTWSSPFFMMTCDSGPQIKTTEYMTYAQYDDVVSAVQGLYNSLDSTCTATYCPQADWAGCVLRIAGHDFMDFKDGEGGSDGCLDFADADNAGLAECIYKGEHGVSIADAYKDFCTSISLADFFVISAEAVMNISRKHTLDEFPSRTPVEFRNKFMYGRTTALNCHFAEGRLPNPENGCSAVEETFVNSLGLTWDEAAALSGVHTLGRAQIKNSGYNGWWSDAENSRRFNNNYFTSIVLKGWAPETNISGNPGKNQWQRVDSGVDEATLGKEMMLNTDMCLFFTMDDDGNVPLDAKTALENECNCTWASAIQFNQAITTYNKDKFCGSTDIPGGSNFPAQRAKCCGEGFDLISHAEIDCGLPIAPQGPAAKAVKTFANNEDRWLHVFEKAWTKVTGNGFALSKPRWN